jgi:L-iditol 2-dehydrogenase
MKSVRLHAIGELNIHEEPIPSPGPDEELVKIKAVGICGSDLHWYSESGIGDSRLDRPLVLGHELSGEIVEGPRKGIRVAVDPALPCEKCEFCLAGHPNLCPSVHFAGHGDTDGGLKEYLAWPSRYLYPLPENVNDIEGAMLEPLGVAIHAINLAHMRPGMHVGVYGCGPIGLMIIQLARLSGASAIYATDRLEHRVEAASRFGADASFMADGNLENQLILEKTQNRGVDIAFEVAGENQAVETSVQTAKIGGKVLLVGIPSVDITSFTASCARRKGLTIKFVRRMKHVYPTAIDLVSRRKIDVFSIVTKTFNLEETPEAFQAAIRRDGLKILVTEFTHG